MTILRKAHSRLSTDVWLAVLEELENPNKRSLDEDEATDISGVGEKERPIGTKQAKKQRSGKGRVKDDDVSLDEDLKKFSDIEAATKKKTGRLLGGAGTHY